MWASLQVCACTYVTVSLLIPFPILTDLCYAACGTFLSRRSATGCSIAAQHQTVCQRHCSSGVCIHVCAHACVQHTKYTYRVRTVHQLIQCTRARTHTQPLTWTSKNLRYLWEEEDGNILTSSPHLLTCIARAQTVEKGARGWSMVTSRATPPEIMMQYSHLLPLYNLYDYT